MGLGSFSIPAEDAGERLGYCITLLLAEVVSMQWAFSLLPNVPYETLIDQYIYGSFKFLFAITVYSILICGIFYDVFDGLFNKSIEFWDYHFGIGALVICVVWQIRFFIIAILARIQEKEHLKETTIKPRRLETETNVDLPIKWTFDHIHSWIKKLDTTAQPEEKKRLPKRKRKSHELTLATYKDDEIQDLLNNTANKSCWESFKSFIEEQVRLSALAFNPRCFETDVDKELRKQQNDQ